MKKYIDAVEAAEVITERTGLPLSELVDVFAEIPAADVAEVVHGEWIAERKDAEYCEFRCSECDESVGQTDQFDETEVKQFSEWYKYCPACGAMMDGDHIGDATKMMDGEKEGV